MPDAASRRRARFTTPLVCRLALSSTTTRGTFDRGSDRTKPRKSCESQVRSAVKTPAAAGPVGGLRVDAAALRALVLDPLPLPRPRPGVGRRQRRRGPALVEVVELDPAGPGLAPQVQQDPLGPRDPDRVPLVAQPAGGPAPPG